MTIYHLTQSVRGRLALARDEAERRILVRELAAAGRERLLVFGLVDDHLHAAIEAERPGYVARDFRRVIRDRRPELPLKVPNLEVVDSRAYLIRLLRYILEQPRKHGMPGPPALWTGGCFQDLVGARLLPGFSPARLANELPRFRLREVFDAVGLDPVPLPGVTDGELRRVGAERLVDLAAGVFAVGPRLAGKSRPVTAARRLAAQVARLTGIRTRAIAEALGTSLRAVRYHVQGQPDQRGIDALRRRLALEVAAAKVAQLSPTQSDSIGGSPQRGLP